MPSVEYDRISVFLGAMLSISSTTIIVRPAAETGKSRERFAEIIFGILVIEHPGHVLLALLSGFAKTGMVDRRTDRLGSRQARGLLAMVLVVGFIGVPRLFKLYRQFKSNEMLLITAPRTLLRVALVALST